MNPASAPQSPGRRLGPSLVLALAYLITGRLGLLLAIPPGYATAAWPPSGIALAGTLLLGDRALAGVALGSFLVNLGVSLEPRSASAALSSALLAAAIAAGAALQAGAGARLIRRFVGFPTPLDRARDVLRFLALGGPVGSLINASWSVTALLLAGGIDRQAAGISWFTWWVGDTIGVLTVVPLVLVFAGQPREIWRRRRVSLALPLATTFALVVLLFVRVRSWEQDRNRTAFQHRAEAAAIALERGFDVHADALQGIGDQLEASPGVAPERFRRIARGALARRPGIRSLAWLPRVTEPEREAFEESARREMGGGFRIWERGIGGQPAPARARAVHVPVLYVEPQASNDAVTGFDVESETARQQAVETALRSGRPAATRPLSLVQARGRRDGLILIRAVFADAGPGQAVERPLLGFVSAAFQVADIARCVLEPIEREGIAVELVDASDAERSLPYDLGVAAGDPATPPRPSDAGREGIAVGLVDARDAERSLPYDLGIAARDPATPPRPSDLEPASATLHVADRTWRLRLSATAAFLAANRGWGAWGVLAAGLSFTCLLGAFLLVVTGHATRVERVVQERTRELAEEVLRRRRSEDSLAERATLLAAQETRLRSSLQEKDTLLQEIDHRVKNNLQVITSLLNLQTESTEDPRARALLASARSRVQAMALVHEQLYRSRDLGKIDLAEYTRALAEKLRHGLRGAGRGIGLSFDTAPVTVAADTAIPCGLILNELVSNALMHAFPAGRGGTIRVGLKPAGPDAVELSVGDDGVGLPPDVDPRRTSTLGLDLVTTLAKQLDAGIAIDRTSGTEFRLVLPVSRALQPVR